jgi:putative DNA primase/helicase
MGKRKSMTFEEFARDNGLLIDQLTLGRWMRVGTVDRPAKRNGAYIFDGHKGAVINFAMHEKHILYRSDEPYIPDPMEGIRRQLAEKERLERQADAAKRAAFICNSVIVEQHPYMIRKGFTDKVKVWHRQIAVPMRVDGHLVGCQLIQEDGQKRFLAGQRTKGASLTIDNKGPNILVEGLATGMSVRRALKHLRQRYTIHVCFSAGNMVEVGSRLQSPIVVADNDPVGVGAAQKIAQRYWVGEAGEDFNDFEQRVGTEAAAESLRPFF